MQFVGAILHDIEITVKGMHFQEVSIDFEHV
jgi:hypothetical protein